MVCTYVVLMAWTAWEAEESVWWVKLMQKYIVLWSSWNLLKPLSFTVLCSPSPPSFIVSLSKTCGGNTWFVSSAECPQLHCSQWQSFLKLRLNVDGKWWIAYEDSCLCNCVKKGTLMWWGDLFVSSVTSSSLFTPPFFASHEPVSVV